LGVAGTRLFFDGWKGDEISSGVNIQVPLDGPKKIEGTWKKQYQLTVNSDYGSPTGSGWYAEGDLASFGTTKPRDPAGIWNQQIFQGWVGDSESTSLTGTILMNGPKTISAEWEVDYSVAMFNGFIIAIAVITGLLIYVKSKKGFGKNKLSKSDNDKKIEKKIKKSTLSSLGEIFNSKSTPKIDDPIIDEQLPETIQSNEPEKTPPQVIASEPIQKTTQIESSIKNMEYERSILSKKSEHLEDSLEKVEHQKNELYS